MGGGGGGEQCVRNSWGELAESLWEGYNDFGPPQIMLLALNVISEEWAVHDHPNQVEYSFCFDNWNTCAYQCPHYCISLVRQDRFLTYSHNRIVNQGKPVDTGMKTACY